MRSHALRGEGGGEGFCEKGRENGVKLESECVVRDSKERTSSKKVDEEVLQCIFRRSPRWGLGKCSIGMNEGEFTLFELC